MTTCKGCKSYNYNDNKCKHIVKTIPYLYIPNCPCFECLVKVTCIDKDKCKLFIDNITKIGLCVYNKIQYTLVGESIKHIVVDDPSSTISDIWNSLKRYK